MQGLIDNMHGQFVQAVADGRHAKVDDIKSIADGRVWTGEQALALHLIDQIGDFRAAVLDTAKSVSIRANRRWCIPRRTVRHCWTCCSGTFPSSCLPGKSCWISTWVLLSVEVSQAAAASRLLPTSPEI